MTKFLKQRCVYEKAKRNKAGEALLDDYGEVQYLPSRSIRCRKEQNVRDMQTSNGAILRSSTRYFIDSSVQLQAEDRLDGHAVLEVSEYEDAFGRVVGYECYV